MAFFLIHTVQCCFRCRAWQASHISQDPSILIFPFFHLLFGHIEPICQFAYYRFLIQNYHTCQIHFGKVAVLYISPHRCQHFQCFVLFFLDVVHVVVLFIKNMTQSFPCFDIFQVHFIFFDLQS